MIVLYIVRDEVIESDIFTFVALSEQDAIKHFHDFCEDMSSSDFKLYSLVSLEHDAAGDEMHVVHVGRRLVFEVPVKEKSDD